MTTHVALLRGINVGGHQKVSMSALREMMNALGFANAATILQSGNLVLDSTRTTGAALERMLEVETAKRLGVSANYIVRTANEWQRMIARNPFSKEAKDDPSHLLVMCLKEPPTIKAFDMLQQSIRGPELIQRDGKQLYIVYPAGIGRSNLTGTLIEQRLDSRGTARNWNTVLKLAALIEDFGKR